MAGLVSAAATLDQLLERTIREWSSQRCEPFPCGQDVWRYACTLAGILPAELPSHRTQAEVDGLLRSKGGLIAYAAELVEGIGWRRLRVPGGEDTRRGDVGVVLAQGQTACAICLGMHWMVRGPALVYMGEAAPLAAWRFD